MSSVQRSVAKGKKTKSLGTVAMVGRASYHGLELDAKVELAPGGSRPANRPRLFPSGADPSRIEPDILGLTFSAYRDVSPCRGPRNSGDLRWCQQPNAASGRAKRH